MRFEGRRPGGGASGVLEQVLGPARASPRFGELLRPELQARAGSALRACGTAGACGTPARSPVSRLGALLALAFAACGPGVSDLGLPSAPLGYLNGRVDLADFSARTGGKPLRAALVWAGVPHADVVCLKYQDSVTDPRFKRACRDPFLFLPGEIGNSVPIDPSGTGTFQIPITRLPSAEVVVAAGDGRVAYASVLVGSDADTNGLLEVLGAFPRAEDVVLGMSFFSLLDQQQRLVFLEGTLDKRSYFYPAPGCEPPAGFSIIETGNVFAQPPVCAVRSMEQGIVVAPLTEPQQQKLSCGLFDKGFVSPPFEDVAPPPDFELVCLNHDLVAMFPPGESQCQSMQIVSLVGCWDGNVFCAEPEWDFRARPPAWWPCP